MAQTKQQRKAMRAVILLALAAAICYAIYSSVTKGKYEVPQVGSQAPDFLLQESDGTVHKLSDYRGKGVLLNFWGTWCEPCEREMPALDRQYKNFRSKGVQVLAVNVGQSAFEVDAYKARVGAGFPFVLDSDKSVMNVYGVTTLPATFAVGPDGAIRAVHAGELTAEQIEEYMKAVTP